LSKIVQRNGYRLWAAVARKRQHVLRQPIETLPGASDLGQVPRRLFLAGTKLLELLTETTGVNPRLTTAVSFRSRKCAILRKFKEIGGIARRRIRVRRTSDSTDGRRNFGKEPFADGNYLVSRRISWAEAVSVRD
jgi:hypothetical protein